MTIRKNIGNISGILLLMLFYNKPITVLGAVTLDQLKTVCMYGFPPDFTNDNLPPKEVCSAMGTFNIFPPPKGIDTSKLKQGLPYVYIQNIECTSYAGNDDKVLVLDESKFKIEDLKREIHDHQVDVLVLRLWERNQLPIAAVPPTVDVFILSIYNDLKTFKKDLLIGLILPMISPSDLMHRLKDTLGDLNSFYVIETIDFHLCQYHQDQNKMKPPLSVTELKNIIGLYSALGYPLFQVFLTVEIAATTMSDEKSRKNYSYKQTCESAYGPYDRFCLTTLADVYSQTTIIHSRDRTPSLAGVFVIWADYDDSTDACQCGRFPALRVIDNGVKGLPKDDTLIGCKTFGKHK